ncbi:MAG: hypothetical protein KGY76_04685 [Candidatus Thermoplasmatota archaeon]|nr:hypothetical protein [Candidatus Thermoplasmatota archaeon]
MKNRIFVITITLSLLLSGLLASVGGEAVDGKRSVSENGESYLQAAQEIHDWHDLDEVRDDLDSDYILMNDLDENTSGYDEVVDTKKGWEPIGDYDRDEDVEFNGAFDGKGYKISDLYINRPKTDYVGLFGGIAHEAEVSDVRLVDVEIDEPDPTTHLAGLQSYDLAFESDNSIKSPPLVPPPSNSIGSIAGYNKGSLSNISVTGIVNGKSGLVGYNSGTVEHSFFSGTLNGSEDHLGGLVGMNDGTIENSYSTGNIVGHYTVGGIVGFNHNGEVSNCYSTTNVTGKSTVGGLVGSNYIHSGGISHSYAIGNVSGDSRIGGLAGTNTGTVETSYAAVNVSGNEDVGGLVGFKTSYGGTVSDSFWDSEKSSIYTSVGGTGLPTREMIGEYAKANMDGFDFDETWETVEEDDGDADKDGYPILQELSREEQLRHIYPAEVDDGGDDNGGDDNGIPGFTSPLLLSATVVAVAIYYERKR